MSLTIPDFDFSLICIVCSFILLLLLYFILPSFPFSIGMLIMIIISIYSWFFEPYLSIYPVMFEIMVLSGYPIYATQRRLRRILSGPRKYKPRKTSFKRAKHVVGEHLDISKGDFQAIPSGCRYDEIFQRLLRSRIRSPPPRIHLETLPFPKEIRSCLKIELPDELHLIGCGAENCVFACGDFAVKIPRVVVNDVKAGFMAHVPMNREIIEKAIEVIKEEIDKVSNLDHRNDLSLIDYSINPPLLVYELADGSSADHDKLDQEEILLIAIQSSEALKYIHSRAIVHGDLKPSNILTPKGVVRLGDFSSTTYLLSRVSGTDPHKCTAGYCAPEQIFIDLRKDPKFGACENRLDIYQLANVILSMLGVEPLDGSRWSEEELESRLSKVECEDLRNLLKKMLSIEPWSRPSAEEVLKSLLTIWKETSSSKKRV